MPTNTGRLIPRSRGVHREKDVSGEPETTVKKKNRKSGPDHLPRTKVIRSTGRDMERREEFRTEGDPFHRDIIYKEGDGSHVHVR